MRPVVTAAEMAAADSAALAQTSLDDLITRAGTAVAHHARRILGGTYGRRVTVVAGKGHNGDDGRVAAAVLRRAGVQVTIFELADAPASLPPADLVIDAAFGTGFHGTYVAPTPPLGTPVLAVDIPSGLDADTGTAGPGATEATETVTFQALKPGLLLGDGPRLAGTVHVVDLGIAIGRPSAVAIEDADVSALVRPRERETHKWKSAVFICAGSPGMVGAAILSASGAMRAGAGMVRLGVPGGVGGRTVPIELVKVPVPHEGFAEAVLTGAEKCLALVVGPGLGRLDAVAPSVHAILDGAEIPIVLDADGLVALGAGDAPATILRRRRAPTVLTPHDGEYAQLTGRPPGPDRLEAARSLAQATGATVLLKGSTTIVATPNGQTRIVTSGSARLATAGSGDVLSGVIAALLARGVEPPEAAALAAHIHGRAASIGLQEGLIASDLPLAIAQVLSRLRP